MSKAALSPREVEALVWTAEGKSAWEIAQILEVAERTVVNHLHNAQTKLNASNRTHAVVIAMRMGLVRLSISLALDAGIDGTINLFGLLSTPIFML